MRVGVFHPGLQTPHQRAVAFQDAGALAWFATSAYFHPESLPVRWADHLPRQIGAPLRSRLLKRYHPPLENRHVRRMGYIEFLELALRRLHAGGLVRRVNAWGNRRFGEQVIKLIQREPVDVVWGFDTSSLEVFRWAKKRGITCVLDQTQGHPAAMNAVLSAEAARHPEFFDSMFQPLPETAIRQQDEEAELADVVVCGSESCAATMRAHGCDPAKLRVVGYGYDERLFPAEPPARPPLDGRPLRLLFAGQIGGRKGMAYLLPAIERLPRDVAELTLVGRRYVPGRTFARYAGRVTHVPQVRRSEIVRHFREADCFIFPSLFEGSAIVLKEAIGAGLGLIQSRSAGEGARDGENGLVLDEISVEAVAEAIRALHADPARLEAWQRASWRIRGDHTWSRYHARIRELLGL